MDGKFSEWSLVFMLIGNPRWSSTNFFYVDQKKLRIAMAESKIKEPNGEMF